MPELTSDGLPVLSEDTCRSLIDIIRRERKKDPNFSEFQRRLQQENPPLYYAIFAIAIAYSESEFSDGFAFGVYISYEALRKQSAANKLKGELPPA